MVSTPRLTPWLDARDAANFLATHWQRAPRVFASAVPELPELPDWRAVVADQGVESRRVTTTEDGRYELEHGPFDGADPEQPWTVLIQDAEKHMPVLRQLLDTLPFLPRWRLEDVMMSVAVAGASVGPHVDEYDVFLVQARGARRWHVGEHGAGVPDDEHGDLRLVKPFAPALSMTAQPGDVLYLPPGVPHHGVAENDCVTLSIGFRAPLLRDLAAVALDHVESQSRLRDAGRTPAPDAMSLDAGSLGALRDQLRALLDDEAALACALGELVTEPKEWLTPALADKGHAPRAGQVCRLHPGARLARFSNAGEEWLFANGERYVLGTGACVAFAKELGQVGCAPCPAESKTLELVEVLLDDGVLSAGDA